MIPVVLPGGLDLVRALGLAVVEAVVTYRELRAPRERHTPRWLSTAS